MRNKTKAQVSRHVRLYHWLLQSAAWRDLDAISQAIYLRLAARYGGTNTNNGKLPFSVREAAEGLKAAPGARSQISIGTASRALANLQAHGFIVAVAKGGFNQKRNDKFRRASEWRLTEFPCDATNAFASKEFMRWEPSEYTPSGKPNGVLLGILSAGKDGPDSSPGDTIEAISDGLGSPGDTARFSSGYVTYPQENRVLNFPNGRALHCGDPGVEEIAPGAVA